jgi:Large extracellular alpha-helical protein
MIETKAVFSRKEPQFEAESCVVSKVIKLSGSEYDRFSRNMNADQDFIRDNQDLMGFEDGARHCLLVVSDERRDGILVHSSGYDYARYAAFVPNAEGLLSVGRYPALADLNKKFTEIVDTIAAQTVPGERSVVYLQDLENDFGIDLVADGYIRQTVFGMLNEHSEVADWEVDKTELILYSTAEPLAEVLPESSVTQADMYAYGYSYDGMIPYDRDSALELFDSGHEIYLLYHNDAEGAASTREEIEAFDGMFGIEDSSWQEPERTVPVEVFLLNREKYERGEPSGEWLKLPADSDTLRDLLERIGVDRPSEGAFSISAVRVQYEVMKEYVSKYDSLDELNLLAVYMNDLEDFERWNLQPMLTSGVADIGRGTSALINLLYEDNFRAFDITDAKNATELGEYWQGDKPEGISIEDYGKEIVADEKGRFTEWGYINFKYDKLQPIYTGIVPDEYKIVGPALHGLRVKTQERSSGKDKPSVLEQLRDARNVPRTPRETDSTQSKKDKGGPEL